MDKGIDTRSDRSRFEKFDSAPLRQGEQKLESQFDKVDSALLYHSEKFKKIESGFDKVESAPRHIWESIRQVWREISAP